MADLKISQLTGATTPLAGTEVLPIVQSSTTKKVSIANVTSGRSTGVLDLTINDGNAGASYKLDRNGTTGFLKFYGAQSGYNGYTFSGIDGDLLEVNNSGNLAPKGNLVPAAAKGINFTANSAAAGMTSQLLNWYEEGTWTPNQGAGLTVIGAFTSSGKYTRIGRQVTIYGYVNGATNVAVAAGGVICTNAPYTSSIFSQGSAANGTPAQGIVVSISSATVYAAAVITASNGIYFTITYFV